MTLLEAAALFSEHQRLCDAEKGFAKTEQWMFWLLRFEPYYFSNGGGLLGGIGQRAFGLCSPAVCKPTDSTCRSTISGAPYLCTLPSLLYLRPGQHEKLSFVWPLCLQCLVVVVDGGRSLF